MIIHKGYRSYHLTTLYSYQHKTQKKAPGKNSNVKKKETHLPNRSTGTNNFRSASVKEQTNISKTFIILWRVKHKNLSREVKTYAIFNNYRQESSDKKSYEGNDDR